MSTPMENCSAADCYSILYMEDDPGLARLLQKKLQRLGHVVDLAVNGKVGMEMLKTGSYDLVLADNDMPELGGLDVIRAIAAMDCSPPVIMVTGNGNEATAIQALKLGAADYLVKDVEMGYLELLPLVLDQVMRTVEASRERDSIIRKLLENEERYRTLVNLSPDGIAIICSDQMVFVNPAGMLQLSNCDDNLELSAKLIEFASGVTPEHANPENCTPYPVASWKELSVTRKNGELIELEVSGVPFIYLEKPAVQIIFRDITERKQASRRLEYLAKYDPLTGLPNRALFFDRIEHSAAADGASQAFAVMFMDLDRFKQVNDGRGHAAGDELLRLAAARIKSAVRDCDTVARMGGDEFTILLPNITSPEPVEAIAGAIIDSINKPFSVLGQDCSIGISIGIALQEADVVPVKELLKNADAALYQVKERGRNGYCLHGQEVVLQ